MDSDFWLTITMSVIMLSVLAIVLTAIVVPFRAKTRDRRERELTKREIAAYIAEGSISPEQGAELMKAAALDHKGASDALDRMA